MFSFASRAAALAPFMLIATVSAQAETLRIDQHVFPAPKGAVTLKNVEVVDSSLSRDDFVKMLAPDTAPAERAALIKNFKATRLSIPTVEAKNDEMTATARDIVLDRVDAGKFDKFVVAGAEAVGGDDLRLKANALTVEGGDFSTVATALIAGDPSRFGARARVMKFDGLTATIRETGPKDKAGLVDVSLAGVRSNSTIEGDVTRSSTFAVDHLVVAPQKGGKLHRDLAAFGYERLDLGVKGVANYDPATKALIVENLTFDGVGAGALTVTASLGDVDKTYDAADPATRLAAFIGANISRATLSYVDSGLFERALAYSAGKKSKETLRREWAQTAGLYLPMLLGGDAGALLIAAAAQKFINDPKSLTLTATGKSGPVRLVELPGLKDPGAFFQRVDLTAVANQ